MNTQLNYYTTKKINPVEIPSDGSKWQHHFEQRKNLQKSSLKNFYLTDEFICKKIDNYREKIVNLRVVVKKIEYKIFGGTDLFPGGLSMRNNTIHDLRVHL